MAIVTPGGGGSSNFALVKEDFIKLGKGLLIACTGAALTYGSEWVVGTSFGIWTPMIVAAWSVVANMARKFIVDTNDPAVP